MYPLVDMLNMLEAWDDGDKDFSVIDISMLFFPYCWLI
jgi:hypothetical protein